MPPSADLPFANYAKEQQAFNDLLRPGCPLTILLFRGDSGSGKTHLLRRCLQTLPQDISSVCFDFKDSLVGIEEFFSRSCTAAGPAPWRSFSHELLRFQQGSRRRVSVALDRNWLIGVNNQINVTLGVNDTAAREERSTALTAAWFEDVSHFSHQLLLVIDTYEKAPAEVSAWFKSSFLARVARTDRLRVVVAGQEVPSQETIEWGHCASQYDLYGVQEAGYWLPVVQAMGLRVPASNPEVFIQGICYALSGNPSEIMKLIRTFPRCQERIH